MGRNSRLEWKINALREMVRDCALKDASFEGYKFTWSSKRCEKDITYIRLVRAFVNDLSLNSFCMNWVLHWEISKSDYLAIVFEVTKIGSVIP